MAEQVFVRTGSHRAGQRLARLLDTTVRELDWHYTMQTGGCLVPIPATMLAEARKIPGVTAARLTSEPAKCWRSSVLG